MKEKIRKRALPVFLSVLLLIGLMPLTVSAASYDGFTYEDNGDGVTITDYTGSGTDITIPTEIDGKPVTAIGNQAFFNCSNLTGIKIPEGVTAIGDQAFQLCTSLKSIEIPASVTTIGTYAFHSCSGLDSVTFAEGSKLEKISDYAFFSCNQLRSMETPSEPQKDDSDTKQAGSPQTGENSSLVFWLALMGVSVFGCIETAVYRRKNKQ